MNPRIAADRACVAIREFINAVSDQSEEGRNILEQITDTRPVVGSAEEALARVSELVDSTWPIPRGAMGAFVIPKPMFDSAQRNALRAALAGEAS